MSNIDDGGPAFPHPVNKHAVGMQYRIVDGMSLLDWFAGQAMAAIICAPDLAQSNILNDHQGNFGEVAEKSYLFADAMLDAKKVAKSEPDWRGIVASLLDIIHDDLTHERQAAHAAALTAARRAVGRA